MYLKSANIINSYFVVLRFYEINTAKYGSSLKI